MRSGKRWSENKKSFDRIGRPWTVQWIWNTLQGINISHLGKRKIIFKMPFFGDMLVSWRAIWIPGCLMGINNCYNLKPGFTSSWPNLSIHPTGILWKAEGRTLPNRSSGKMFDSNVGSSALETNTVEKGAPGCNNGDFFRWSLQEPISCTRCRRQVLFILNKRCLKFYHRMR